MCVCMCVRCFFFSFYRNLSVSRSISMRNIRGWFRGVSCVHTPCVGILLSFIVWNSNISNAIQWCWHTTSRTTKRTKRKKRKSEMKLNDVKWKIEFIKTIKQQTPWFIERVYFSTPNLCECVWSVFLCFISVSASVGAVVRHRKYHGKIEI